MKNFQSPWTVRQKFRGTLSDKSEAIVMDNSKDRDAPNKIVVDYFITEKIDLLAGSNTVAIFKLKKFHDWIDETSLVGDLNAGDLFRSNAFSHLLIVKSTNADGKIEVLNPFGQILLKEPDQIVYVVERKEQKKDELNSTGLFTAYLNKKKVPLQQ